MTTKFHSSLLLSPLVESRITKTGFLFMTCTWEASVGGGVGGVRAQ